MLVASTTKAGHKEWIGLVILVLPTLVVSMDMTVTYLALPVLSTQFKPTSTELLWITDIFGFFEAGLLIIMGALGDRLGLRKILLLGATAFTAASVLAAFSPNVFWIIMARAVMGIAGATILPTVISLIRNMFNDDKQRTFAMGLYTTCFSSGTMLGPIIGGFLLSHFWWGSIFLMPVPLIMLLLVAAPAYLPEFKHPDTKALDFMSAVTLIAAILLIIFGLKQLAQDGFKLLPFVSMTAGIALAIVFIQRQRTVTNPLIDLELFKRKAFNTSLAALFTGLFSWAGIFIFVTQYQQSVLGLSTLAAGLWLLPGALGSILLCMLVPFILRHLSRSNAMALGLAVMATGIALLMFITSNSLPLLVVACFLMSGGCGLTVTLGIDNVVATAPPEKAGVAAGISETSTGFGASFGIAVLGSIWTAIYRANMPADIAAAQDTIGGAVEESARLNNPGLLIHAQEAFVHSTHITAGICAVIIALMAVKVKLTD